MDRWDGGAIDWINKLTTVRRSRSGLEAPELQGNDDDVIQRKIAVEKHSHRGNNLSVGYEIQAISVAKSSVEQWAHGGSRPIGRHALIYDHNYMVQKRHS